MTAIFISHSSEDNAAAARMKAWLEEQGHASLFLDFDPETGIRAGSDWEETLYYKLRQCQAVIALLTPNWLASKWCFAELVQAREKGKAIFPVKVEPCDAGGVFGDIQHIDLTDDSDKGYRLLALGLLERGLDPRDVFDWDPQRPPYPGLLAFQEADAAIFFGRGAEVLHGLETLDALRRRGRGAPRLVLFLGASGSGKSSLVRAGLIPRLKKTPSEWLPLAPFRPQADPLDELALAFADTFEGLEQPRPWGELRQVLKAAAEPEPPDSGVLLTLARELTLAARQREATVVLPIDQAEELFGYSAPVAAARFLRLLRAALEASDRQLMVVATLRSDFLGEFQTHPFLHDPAYDHDFAYQTVPVDPMPERHFVEIIRSPARLAGLRLEEGLVEAMASDTGTRDALPLLAFTLRRLYDRYGADGVLELREYEELGRLEGALRTEADWVLKDADPSPEDLGALRAAFVPTMVRINADGSYARRRAHADEIPPRATRLIKRFVDARLLVSDRDKDGRETIEVAHEALLRIWLQLADWLAEDQDKLRLLESLHRAAGDWDKGGRPADLLVHRDGRLQDAEALISNPRFVLQESSLEKRYLDACIDSQHAREAAEREEQERRLQDAERIAEEQRRAALAQKKTAQRTGAGLVIALVLALAAGWQYWVATSAKVEAENNAVAAKQQAAMALSRQLSAQALQIAQQPNEFDGFFDRAILLALQAVQLTDTPESRSALLRLLQSNPDIAPFQRGKLHADQAAMRAVAFSSDGKTLAGAADSGAVILWDLVTGKQRGEPLRGHKGEVWKVAFSSDGNTLASAGGDKTVRLWDVATGKQRGEPLRGHKVFVSDIAFSSDGNTLASAGRDKKVRLWDVATGTLRGEPVQLAYADGTGDIVFSPDNTALAIASGKTISFWDVVTGKQRGEPLRGHKGSVRDMAFSSDGNTLASASRDKTVRLWDVATGTQLGKELRGHKGEVWKVAFSPDGRTLASAGKDKKVLLWNVATGMPQGEIPVSSIILGIAFSPDGKILAIINWINVELWHMADGPPLGRAMQFGGNGGVLSPDGMTVATDHAYSVRLSDVATGMPRRENLQGYGRGVRGMAFSPDGKTFAGGTDRKVLFWDVATGTRQDRPLLSHENIGNLGASIEAFSPDGKTLASSNSKTVLLWDLATGTPQGEPLLGHEGRVKDVAFSPDGKTLASASMDNTVRMWDVATSMPQGKPLHGHTSWVQTVTFSPDGKTLASGGTDETVRLWDAATGKPQGEPLRGHRLSVKALAFSPDGKTIAGTDRDSTVLLWDVATGTRLGDPLPRLPKQVPVTNYSVDLVFSRDGKTLIVVGHRRIWFWDMDWKSRACRIARRNLSQDEWNIYLGSEEYEPACANLSAPDG